MQAEPGLRRRRLRRQGLPRGAARVRGRGGDPRGARLPRPRHRLREDGRAQPRAGPRGSTSWSRSAGRCWSASRARARSAGSSATRRDDRHARRRRSARRSPRSSAARRSSARTTSASTSRRCASRGRSRDTVKIELRGPRALRPPRRAEDEREHGQLFVYDVELEVGERGASDRIEDAVDYREVAATVREVAEPAVPRCSRRWPPRSPTRSYEHFPPSSGSRCACASRRSARPGSTLEFAAVTAERAVTTRRYVGLGANLGDREAVRSARRRELHRRRARLSTIRETEPWGLADQPRFLNAVAELETDRTPRELLDRLLEIERELGRVRDGPALGAARDRPRPAALRRRAIDEPGLDGAASAAARTAVRARAARRARSRRWSFRAAGGVGTAREATIAD